ncbi:MAG: hypothetical protein ISS57_08470 [Anaerolineales bacterium]|nr:hypothetical protein [Anaerolineales bacterium]
MRVFIAGVMQGSKKDKGITGQDYRQIIREAIHEKHPEAEVVDPFSLFPDSPEYGDGRARQVLIDMANEAGQSDIVIAYLPVASMGTALEMIRAYDNGKSVISISPMAENWVVRSLSQHIFPTMESFIDWVRDGGLKTV